MSSELKPEMILPELCPDCRKKMRAFYRHGRRVSAVEYDAAQPVFALITETVARVFHMPDASRLRAPGRMQYRVLARQIAIFLSREITGASWPNIGFYFRRDHSTAIHAHRQIAARCESSRPFAATLAQIRAEVEPRRMPQPAPEVAA